MENPAGYLYTPVLIAKERQLLNTLRALEAMLESVQELRTKVNFERTQLITLIEMVKARSRGEQPEQHQRTQTESKPDGTSDDSNRDPLVLLDKLYNGAFSISEEEEDDEDDDDLEGDNFGIDSVQW